MAAIYLDHASTTPVLPDVLEAMRPFWNETFANPASAHRPGQRARQALESAREFVAELLGAFPDEVVFTSGATEANNLALKGSLHGLKPARIVVSPIEHPSVSEPATWLQQEGHEVRHLAVDASGRVEPASLNQALAHPCDLLTVMLANNETGVLQPVKELVEAAGTRIAHFHCDAVQAVGKVPVDFHGLGVSTMSLSAHKFHGPRGIGALLVRRGARLRPLFLGGHQQNGVRPGTEPVVLAVGLAKALELACADLQERYTQVARVRDTFLQLLSDQAAPVVVNGSAEHSLPHILNVSFPGCPADILLMKLDLAGVACSTGSACSSGSLLPSPVLRAMGLPDSLLRTALRFSFSHLTTMEQVREASGRIVAAVAELRQVQLGSLTSSTALA